MKQQVSLMDKTQMIANFQTLFQQDPSSAAYLDFSTLQLVVLTGTPLSGLAQLADQHAQNERRGYTHV